WPLYQFGVGVGLWQPFTCPSGVSPRARYVAGLKDREWYECWFDRSKEVDICRVWDDAGHLLAYGSYRFDGENRAATTAELRPSGVLPYPGHPELSWI